MKTSSPTQPKKVEPPAILLIGPPGGGKTTIGLQFPDVCVVLCNDHLDGPERAIRQKKKDFIYKWIVADEDASGKIVATQNAFDQLLLHLTSLLNEPSVRTVLIDNLTTVNEWVKRKICALQSRTTMETRDWDSFAAQMMTLFHGRIRALRGIGKVVICTVHEKTLEKPNPQNFMIPIPFSYKPTVQGQVGDALGGFFTDVLRCTGDIKAGGTPVFYVHTARDSMSDLKNSRGMPAKLTFEQGELIWPEMSKWFGAFYQNGV